MILFCPKCHAQVNVKTPGFIVLEGMVFFCLDCQNVSKIDHGSLRHATADELKASGIDEKYRQTVRKRMTASSN